MKATKKFKDFALKHAKIRKDKKVKGFTLVELIIVIAIIGILAAILIPTMTGKIKEAKMKTANDAAAKIAEQAAIMLIDLMADGKTFGNGSYYASTYEPNANGLGADNKVIKTITDAVPSLKGGSVWGFEVQGNAVVSAVYVAKSGDYYVGMYPNAPKEPQTSAGMTKNNISAMLTSAKAGS